MKRFVIVMTLLVIAAFSLSAGSISGMIEGGLPDSCLHISAIQPETPGMSVEGEIEDGEYSISGLEEGTYLVLLHGFQIHLFYDGANNPEDAVPIIISEENTEVTGIDFVIEPPSVGLIRGHITGIGGNGPGGQIPEGSILLYDEQPLDASVEPVSELELEMPHYVFNELEFDTYYVALDLEDRPVIYFDNTENSEEAEEIVLNQENPVAIHINFDLGDGGFDEQGLLTGQIFGDWFQQEFSIKVYDEIPINDNIEPITEVSSWNHHYFVPNLEMGTYYVECEDEDGQYQFYDHVQEAENAAPVIITEDQPVAHNINFTMEGVPGGSGMISGTVTDSEGEVVDEALIILRRPQGNGGPHGGQPQMTITDEFGEYELTEIPTGDYYLAVMAPFYLPYFYDGVEHWSEADLITIEDETEMEINPVLNPMEMYSISGTVLDDSGEPIENCTIFAHRIGANNGNPNGQCQNNLQTQPDENGEYLLDLPEGEFIIGVHTNYMPTQVQFYDHADNIDEAEILGITEDLTNIDFDLEIDDDYDGSLSGVVNGGTDSVEGALIMAYAEDQSFAGTTVADETGFYEFPNMPEGDYYLAAMAPSYVPTFYPGVIDYEEAETIFVNGAVENIDFELIPMNGNGFLTVNGQVTDTDNDYVANATVLFTDEEGNVVTTAQTNDEGYYSVTGLSEGEVTGLATKTYYDSGHETNTINDDMTIDFSIEPESPTATGETDMEENVLSINNYPNPFNPKTTIEFSLTEASNVKVIVYDIKGKEVVSLVENQDLSAGAHSVKWTGKDSDNKTVASGIYFYRISTGNKSVTQKMILLK